LPCGVRGGRAYGDGVVHPLVPAAHFWDDIEARAIFARVGLAGAFWDL
jgi:hypothetical protein